ncbi:hypothetical protein WA158_001051 [Blastocystis sp. Blastoise]
MAMELKAIIRKLNSDSTEEINNGLLDFNNSFEIYKNRNKDGKLENGLKSLLDEYIASSPDAVELFSIWKDLEGNSAIPAFKSLIDLFGNAIFYSTNDAWKKKVSISILNKHSNELLSILSGQDKDIINCVYKLLGNIADIGEGAVKLISAKIPIYTLKVIPSAISDKKTRYRSCRFICSVLRNDPSSSKQLCANKDLMKVFIGNTHLDSEVLCREILYAVDKYIIQNTEISINTKQSLFSPVLISNFLSCYNKTDKSKVYIHYFLLSLFGNQSYSIYKSFSHLQFSSPIPSIPQKVILSLNPTSEYYQKQLYLQILQIHPHLLASVFKSNKYILEPRDSDAWVKNVQLITNMIRLETVLPEDCIDMYNNNMNKFYEELHAWILPTSINRQLLVKGLQSQNLRVIYYSLLLAYISIEKIYTTGQKLSQMFTEAKKSFNLQDYYKYFSSILNLYGALTPLYSYLLGEYKTYVIEMKEKSISDENNNKDITIITTSNVESNTSKDADSLGDLQMNFDVTKGLDNDIQRRIIEEEEKDKQNNEIQYSYMNIFKKLEFIIHIYSNIYKDLYNYIYIDPRMITSVLSLYMKLDKERVMKNIYIENNEVQRMQSVITSLFQVLLYIEKDNDNLYTYVKDTHIEDTALFVLLNFMIYIDKTSDMYKLAFDLIVILLQNGHVFSLTQEAYMGDLGKLALTLALQDDFIPYFLYTLKDTFLNKLKYLPILTQSSILLPPFYISLLYVSQKYKVPCLFNYISTLSTLLLYIPSFAPSIQILAKHYSDSTVSPYKGGFWDFQFDPLLISIYKHISESNSRYVESPAVIDYILHFLPFLINMISSTSSSRQSITIKDSSFFHIYFRNFTLPLLININENQQVKPMYIENYQFLSCFLPLSTLALNNCSIAFAIENENVFNWLLENIPKTCLEIEIRMNFFFRILYYYSTLGIPCSNSFLSHMNQLINKYLSILLQDNEDIYINVIHNIYIQKLIHIPNTPFTSTLITLFKSIGFSTINSMSLNIDLLLYYICNSDNQDTIITEGIQLNKELNCFSIQLLLTLYQKLPIDLQMSIYTLILDRIKEEDIQLLLKDEIIELVLPLNKDIYIRLINIIKKEKDQQKVLIRILYRSFCKYIYDYNIQNNIILTKNDKESKHEHLYKKNIVAINSKIYKYDFLFLMEYIDEDIMTICIKNCSDTIFRQFLDLLFMLDSNISMLFIDLLFDNEKYLSKFKKNPGYYINILYIALLSIPSHLYYNILQHITPQLFDIYINSIKNDECEYTLEYGQFFLQYYPECIVSTQETLLKLIKDILPVGSKASIYKYDHYHLFVLIVEYLIHMNELDEASHLVDNKNNMEIEKEENKDIISIICQLIRRGLQTICKQWSNKAYEYELKNDKEEEEAEKKKNEVLIHLYEQNQHGYIETSRCCTIYNERIIKDLLLLFDLCPKGVLQVFIDHPDTVNKCIKQCLKSQLLCSHSMNILYNLLNVLWNNTNVLKNGDSNKLVEDYSMEKVYSMITSHSSFTNVINNIRKCRLSSNEQYIKERWTTYNKDNYQYSVIILSLFKLIFEKKPELCTKPFLNTLLSCYSISYSPLDLVIRNIFIDLYKYNNPINLDIVQWVFGSFARTQDVDKDIHIEFDWFFEEVPSLRFRHSIESFPIYIDIEKQEKMKLEKKKALEEKRMAIESDNEDDDSSSSSNSSSSSDSSSSSSDNSSDDEHEDKKKKIKNIKKNTSSKKDKEDDASSVSSSSTLSSSWETSSSESEEEEKGKNSHGNEKDSNSMKKKLNKIDESTYDKNSLQYILTTPLELLLQNTRDCVLFIDPSFFLPLLKYYILHSTLNLRHVISQGIVGYLTICLSCKEKHIHSLASDLLESIWELLLKADFWEVSQILLLLRSLRNSLETPSTLLSPLLATFISESCGILLRPSHTLYTPLNRFLLSRPSIDLLDVPMFYQLFGSGTTDYKQERAWLLRVLFKGLQREQDFKIFKRRHVISQLSLFVSSSISDVYSKKLFFLMLLRVSTIPRLAQKLYNDYSILPWLFSFISNNASRLFVYSTVQILLNMCTSMKKIEYLRSFISQIILLLSRCCEYITMNSVQEDLECFANICLIYNKLLMIVQKYCSSIEKQNEMNDSHTVDYKTIQIVNSLLSIKDIINNTNKSLTKSYINKSFICLITNDSESALYELSNEDYFYFYEPRNIPSEEIIEEYIKTLTSISTITESLSKFVE